jgi:hypothetical protein
MCSFCSSFVNARSKTSTRYIVNSESENAKIAGKNEVDCIFYAKGIIHHEFVPEKQTVDSEFYKEVV